MTYIHYKQLLQHLKTTKVCVNYSLKRFLFKDVHILKTFSLSLLRNCNLIGNA